MKLNLLHAALVTCLFWLFTASGVAYAHDIAITNITLTGQNISGGYTLVQFDISWENSLHDPINYYFQKISNS